MFLNALKDITCERPESDFYKKLILITKFKNINVKILLIDV